MSLRVVCFGHSGSRAVELRPRATSSGSELLLSLSGLGVFIKVPEGCCKSSARVWAVRVCLEGQGT